MFDLKPLKPCPYCGGAALRRYEIIRSCSDSIFCSDCPLTLVPCKRARTMQELELIWNNLPREEDQKC